MSSAANHPYQSQIQALDEKIETNQELLSDPELKSLAQEEVRKLQQQKQALEVAAKEYKQALEEKKQAQQDPTRQSAAILEIRAGAGGDEAKIWASDLLRMYVRFAESLGLKITFIDDLVVKFAGQAQLGSKKYFAYQLFKQEAGVHRVQRVPTTETQGRIHTSTASVAVLPEIKAQDVTIKDEDLEWEFMRSSGAGGQSVNKTSSAVRLTHQPTDICIRVSQERSQLQNREIALELLRSQLWEKQELERQKKLGKARAAIGRNRRAEKIRTYNYPQNRVTDHRVKESWHQLEDIVDGDLENVLIEVKAGLTQRKQAPSQTEANAEQAKTKQTKTE